MSNITEAPIYSPLVDDDGKAMIPWVLFFNQLYQGDIGTTWTPTFVSLAQTGTPTITGKYYKLSGSLVYFRVTIIPGTDTTSTFGTTYIDNFPLTIDADGQCGAVTGINGSAVGTVVSSSTRIYTPGWTSVTGAVTITGTIEAH